MKRAIIPYVIFKTKSGIYGIDAYTSLRVEKPERIATLVKKFNTIPELIDEHKLALLSADELPTFLELLREDLQGKANSTMRRRVSKMRRWNIFRLLGIPTGHSRHIQEEEKLAKENREALLALSILDVVLKGGVKPLGYSLLELEFEGDKVYINGKLDGVYTELIKVDMRAAMALLEISR
ncbi:hypothetical protein PNA2_1774 [Pyrococcus sp. NA2]|uniref:hypothetical protein n=1 Tax=Pyrococcus sp. (strain NA2) TaxID=342949 RepID=UPI000209AB95|nr:hypothetical protein [Pyrococcus sp. NA2]AEC52688.1 hypothetical protein PNA2_1774 [Pyrococcus sp. NA2]